MEKLCSMIIIIIVLVLFMPYCAQATNEVNTNKLSLEVFDIVSGNDAKRMHAAADYSIEILKTAPWSMDAYKAISFFNDYMIFEDFENFKVRYKRLGEKYFSTIGDLDADTAEKLMLLNFYGAAMDDDATAVKTSAVLKKIRRILEKNKNSAKDRKTQALILMMQFLVYDNKLSFFNEFLRKFPDHPAAPLAELDKLPLMYKNDPRRLIEEIEKWIAKNEKTPSPYGWKLSVFGYDELMHCYSRLKDAKNVRKCVELLYGVNPNFFGGIKARWIDYPNNFKFSEIK